MAQGDVAGDSKGPGHVMDLLKQFDFLSISLSGKIHCSLTNRDLPLRVDAVQQHLNSKKLKKEREWYKADYSKYEPLVVAHKTNPKMLYCTLTNTELNRIPKEVEAHVKGKRFLNRKAEMEGLKQGQRQPATAGSDDEFWAPTGDAETNAMEEASDDDGDDDVDGKDKKEEESDEEKPRPRGGKKNTKASARESTVREKKNRGKGGKTKADAKASRPSEANGDGKENGVSLGSQPADSKGREKQGRKGKSGKRNSQAAAGGSSNKPNARKGNAVPLSDDTPAVSKSTKGGKTAGEDKPQRSPKGNGRGKGKSSATPAGEGDTTAMAASVAKRKHNVSDEPARKKKRKA